MSNRQIRLDNKKKLLEVIPMFERAAICSALLVFAGFCSASVKFFQFTGLQAESPVIVFQEMFPPINTSDN